jgi:hypothetical protein
MNTLSRAVAVGTGTVVLALAATTVPANAATRQVKQPTATVISPVFALPAAGVAALAIRYSCSQTVSPANHLYVGLKQGPKVNTTDHSSSEFAESFYSTNWSSDAGPNKMTCDGRKHTQIIVLKPQPSGFGWTEKAPLRTGKALVQLCVYDNVTSPLNAPGEPVGGKAIDYRMHMVYAPGR